MSTFAAAKTTPMSSYTGRFGDESTATKKNTERRSHRKRALPADDLKEAMNRQVPQGRGAAQRGLFRSQISSPNSTMQKEDSHHIKIPAHAWSTKYR
jgi:hypothetical protein